MDKTVFSLRTSVHADELDDLKGLPTTVLKWQSGNRHLDYEDGLQVKGFLESRGMACVRAEEVGRALDTYRFAVYVENVASTLGSQKFAPRVAALVVKQAFTMNNSEFSLFFDVRPPEMDTLRPVSALWKGAGANVGYGRMSKMHSRFADTKYVLDVLKGSTIEDLFVALDDKNRMVLFGTHAEDAEALEQFQQRFPEGSAQVGSIVVPSLRMPRIVDFIADVSEGTGEFFKHAGIADAPEQSTSLGYYRNMRTDSKWRVVRAMDQADWPAKVETSTVTDLAVIKSLRYSQVMRWLQAYAALGENRDILPIHDVVITPHVCLVAMPNLFKRGYYHRSEGKLTPEEEAQKRNTEAYLRDHGARHVDWNPGNYFFHKNRKYMAVVDWDDFGKSATSGLNLSP